MTNTNDKLLNRVHSIVAFVISEMYERNIKDCAFGEISTVKGSFKQPEDSDPEDNLLDVGTVLIGASDKLMGLACAIITDLLWHDCSKVKLFTRFDFEFNEIRFYGVYLENADTDQCLNFADEEKEVNLLIIDDPLKEVPGEDPINEVENFFEGEELLTKSELVALHWQINFTEKIKSRYDTETKENDSCYSAIFSRKSDMVKYMRAMQRISKLYRYEYDVTYEWEQGIISFFVTKKT